MSKDLQFIKDTASDEIERDHLKLVFKLHFEIFGETCQGCPSKIAGYIKKLKNYNPETDMKKSESVFILKTGKQIVISGQSQAYSNANLTDEIAIAFIKGNINRKALFAKLPENLEAVLNGEVADEKALTDYTMAELKALYPEVKGRSKADVIFNIEESIKAAVLNDEVEEKETSNDVSEEE